VRVLLDLVPSSARSTAASASPLPKQFVPLLEEQFERVKEVVKKALPVNKRLTALEEAEYEDDDGDGALEKEIQLQGMHSLLLLRCRLLNVFILVCSTGNASSI
jgi:hypothetical protein